MNLETDILASWLSLRHFNEVKRVELSHDLFSSHKHKLIFALESDTELNDMARIVKYKAAGLFDYYNAMKDSGGTARDAKQLCVLIRRHLAGNRIGAFTEHSKIIEDVITNRPETLAEELRRIAEEIEIKEYNDKGKKCFANYIHWLEKMHKGEHSPTPTWGIKKLDDVLGGMTRGVLTCVAGPTSSFKSGFAVWCMGRALIHEYKALICSTEMPVKAIQKRFLSVWSNIPGTLVDAPHNFEEIKFSASDLDTKGLRIVDNAYSLKTLEAELSAERADVVVYDYIQNCTDTWGEGKVNDLENICAKLLRLAIQYDTHIIAISQVNRQDAGNTDRRVKLSHLRGSGGIEQSARIVLGLCWPWYHNKRMDKNRFEIDILKNSEGPSGETILLTVDTGTGVFSESEPTKEDYRE